MARHIELFNSPECIKCQRRIGNNCISLTRYSYPCGSFTIDRDKIIKEIDDSIAYHNKYGASRISAIRKLEEEKRDILTEWSKDIEDAYKNSTNVIIRGSNSESDSNNKTSLKAKMKDNRDLACKQNQKQKEEYINALRNFEEETGVKLDKLRPNDGITRSNIDSYTGEEIPEDYLNKKKK